MTGIPLIGPVFGFFGKLAELGTWSSLFHYATGDGFFASVTIGVLAFLILLLWRLPKLGPINLSGFTGKVALCAILGLVVLAVLAFLIVVYQREVQPRAAAAAGRAANRSAPSSGAAGIVQPGQHPNGSPQQCEGCE